MLAHVGAPAQFGETCDDEVANLVELRIARYQEHIPCYAISQHLFACNSIIAQC